MLKTFGKTISAGAIALAALGSFATANAAEVTVTAASCFPIGSPPGKPFEKAVAAINEKGKGIIQIDLKGGAPAIGSPFTLTQKMSRGAYDLVGCTESYFGNVIAEAPVLRLAEKSYAELRKNGGLALVSKLLAAKNIHYVGRHHDFGPFHLWLAQEDRQA